MSPAERSAGVQDSREPAQSPQALDAVLEDVSVLGIAEAICAIFGRARGRRRHAGQLMGAVDLLIAATGLHDGLTGLTNNRQHCERVEGLQIESV